MNQLKRNTALAALTTQTFIIVPSAFAVGEPATAAATAAPVAPVVIAAVSAAAVAGFVGWGMKARKYRKLEDSYRKHKVYEEFAASQKKTRRSSALAGAELEATFAARLRGKDLTTSIPASAGTYIPAHARGINIASPDVTTGDMLNKLEEKYSDIIHKSTGLPRVIEIPYVSDAPVTGYRASHVVEREADEAPAVETGRVFVHSLVEPARFGEHSNEKVARLVPRVNQYRLAPKPGDTADIPPEVAAEIDAVMAEVEARENAAREIARAGIASGRATAQAAKAVRAAGAHVAYDAARRDKELPAVPVRRGPGFVDVNDNTFSRSGALVAQVGPNDSIAAVGGFGAQSVMSVRYPAQEDRSSDMFVVGNSPNTTMSGMFSAVQSSVLTALPVV